MTFLTMQQPLPSVPEKNSCDATACNTSPTSKTRKRKTEKRENNRKRKIPPTNFIIQNDWIGIGGMIQTENMKVNDCINHEDPATET